MVKKLQAISLFSNCGAGDLGYRSSGFEFQVMAELDPRRLEVCSLNHPEATTIAGDLRETWKNVVEEYSSAKEELDLLAACPPCQGMSSARGVRGRGEDPDDGMKDRRNLLAVVIADVAEKLSPKLIVVENVPAFLTRKVRHPETNIAVSAANLLVSMLASQYCVFPVLTDLCEYGVPQSRRRTFLTFIRKDLDVSLYLHKNNLTPYPEPTHLPELGVDPVNLVDALNKLKLPSLDAAKAESANDVTRSGWHSVPVWSSQRYTMISSIPKNSGQTAWQNKNCTHCGNIVEDFDVATCNNCNNPLPRPVVKREDGTYRLIKGFRTSSYKRVHLDRPAATITTGSGHIGSSSTIHPYENRLFSLLNALTSKPFQRISNGEKL